MGNQTQSFDYDALDRLESASAATGDGAYAEAYEYYKGGSLKRKGDPNNLIDGLYDYTDPNHHHAATGYRGNAYSYDDNGNMTGRIVDSTNYTLTYDAENHLETVSDNGNITTFYYDADGGRVKKVDEEGNVTHYPGPHYEALLGDTSLQQGQAAAAATGPQMLSGDDNPSPVEAAARNLP